MILADRNIRHHHWADQAAWLWHPECGVDEPVFLRFRCRFVVPSQCHVCLHVTADQQYRLFLDDRRIGQGPARGDVAHWCVDDIECELAPGEHVLESEVWWLGEHAPLSLMTLRGGFLLTAEGPLMESVATGSGAWQVARRRGTTFTRHNLHTYVVIGDHLHTDLAAWSLSGEEWTEPAIVRGPVIENPYGVDQVGGWRCVPSGLPPAFERTISCDRLRAVANSYCDGYVFGENDSTTENIPMTIPARSRVGLLWDLEEYVCGHYGIYFGGGRGARLDCRWAESLFDPHTGLKGHRDEIGGKVFRGLGNSCTAEGRDGAWGSYWPCSGRYLLLEIETADEPLQIREWFVREQRYPLDMLARVQLDDPQLAATIPLCLRALQCCSHDTLMDCPHYEQLMYVGDTRLELLTLYAISSDSQLPERCLLLQDQSRSRFGFTAMRYPSREDQLSPTFAAISVCCLHDYACWRDHPKFVRDRLPGMRANLDAFLPYRRESGLLEELPGWTFIDWVTGWNQGVGRGHLTGCCALSNLFYLLALQSAADLEMWYGESLMARRYREMAKATKDAIGLAFWSDKRQALADDREQKCYSQHGQSLGIIGGVVPQAQRKALMRKALHDTEFARASIYFRYYLFEALYRSGMGQELRAEYAPWFELQENGLRTTVEQDEPTRSDCHGWGAHALYHLIASLGGIRPAAPGFEEVRVAPVVGGLKRVDMSVPHPGGMIEVNMQRVKGRWEGNVDLCKDRNVLAP